MSTPSRFMPTRVSWDAPFWSAAAQGLLVAQRCRDCGRLQHYPRPACIDCLSQSREWVPLSGLGSVWSFTIIRQAADPSFADEVPFVLADIELVEGLRIVTRIEDGIGVRIGDLVKIVPPPVSGPSRPIPYFRLVG